MITGIDHIVLCVRDVGRTIAFYEKTLGMQPNTTLPRGLINLLKKAS